MLGRVQQPCIHYSRVSHLPNVRQHICRLQCAKYIMAFSNHTPHIHLARFNSFILSSAVFGIPDHSKWSRLWKQAILSYLWSLSTTASCSLQQMAMMSNYGMPTTSLWLSLSPFPTMLNPPATVPPSRSLHGVVKTCGSICTTLPRVKKLTATKVTCLVILLLLPVSKRFLQCCVPEDGASMTCCTCMACSDVNARMVESACADQPKQGGISISISQLECSLLSNDDLLTLCA